MADVLDDLIPYAATNRGVLSQREDVHATEGRDFEYVFTATEDGVPIDLTGCTATATVYAGVAGAELVTLTATTGVGFIKVTGTGAQMASLAADFKSTRPCPWGCYLSLSGRTVQAWGPNTSTLYINQGD